MWAPWFQNQVEALQRDAKACVRGEGQGPTGLLCEELQPGEESNMPAKPLLSPMRTRNTKQISDLPARWSHWCDSSGCVLLGTELPSLGKQETAHFIYLGAACFYGTWFLLTQDLRWHTQTGRMHWSYSHTSPLLHTPCQPLGISIPLSAQLFCLF